MTLRTILKLTGITKIPFLRVWGWKMLKSIRLPIALPIQGMKLAHFPAKYIVDGIYEPETTNYFKKYIKPGMVVVDVGANVGYYSVLAAKCGAKVYAFEPSPRNLKALSKNIRLNLCEGKIIVYPKAVANSEGVVTLYVREGGSTSDSLFPDHQSRYESVPISTEVTTLDATLEGVRVDLVKIDAEGADIEVLEGMRKLLSNNPTTQVIVEYARNNLIAIGHNPEHFLGKLKEMGFTCQTFDQDGSLRDVTEFERHHSDKYLNLVLRSV